MPGKSPFHQVACAWPSVLPAPGDRRRCQREGLSGQPVRQLFHCRRNVSVGKPGVITPRRSRGGQALLHSREQKAGQQLWGWRRPGLWGQNENVGKKGITFRNLGLEIGAGNQILRGSKSRRGSPKGPGRAYWQAGMGVSLDPGSYLFNDP